MAWAEIAQLALQVGGKLMGLFGGNGNDAEEQFNYNMAFQRQQQEWLERMSSTAHQREKADLLAAGFNPLLALNNGASTPNGGLNSLGSDLSSSKNMERQNKINAVLGIWNAQQNQQAVTSASNLQNAQAQNQLADAGLKTIQTIQTKLDSLFKKKDLDNYEKRLTVELEKGMTDVLKGQVSSAREANLSQLDTFNAYTNRMNAYTNAYNAKTSRIVGNATEAKLKKEIERINKPILNHSTSVNLPFGLGGISLSDQKIKEEPKGKWVTVKNKYGKGTHKEYQMY